MAKRTATFPLALPPRDDGAPASRWLYEALRGEILDGRLRPGDRLPATRDLARQYGLSRGTIVNAFAQLRAEGYVRGTVGSGTYVSRVLPDDLLHVARRGGTAAARRSVRRHLAGFGERVRAFPQYDQRRIRAFRSHQPALDLFPTALWAQVTARRLRRASSGLLLGCAPMGYEPLRELVASYLRTSRGVTCVAAQVAIVSGVQEALDLAARLFVDAGDRVVIEDPGYVGAALVFEAAGARVVPVPLDDEGMTIPGSAARGARLAYVTPAHQFPTGVAMSLARRIALLEWARGVEALIFEDDYDSEYRYAGRPAPALQSLDTHGLVLFAGSFSKVLFPSLRLGYLVVPLDLTERIEAARSAVSRHAPLIDQAVLTDFITAGHFARHVRRMREVYAERRAVLLDAVRERLDGALEISGIEAGLQAAAWLAPGLDARAVAAAALARHVDAIPLDAYTRARDGRQGLLLGFAAVDPTELRRGVRELAVALDGVRRRS